MLVKARDKLGMYCKGCLICNGKACTNQIPGAGAKGSGTVAIKNYDAWQNIELVMDTFVENKLISTNINFFGKSFDYPFLQFQ